MEIINKESSKEKTIIILISNSKIRRIDENVTIKTNIKIKIKQIGIKIQIKIKVINYIG